MALVVVVILLSLSVLILAGPMLENLIDQFWPPTRHR
jgi:hypothetical protein